MFSYAVGWFLFVPIMLMHSKFCFLFFSFNDSIFNSSQDIQLCLSTPSMRSFSTLATVTSGLQISTLLSESPQHSPWCTQSSPSPSSLCPALTSSHHPKKHQCPHQTQSLLYKPQHAILTGIKTTIVRSPCSRHPHIRCEHTFAPIITDRSPHT
jgi:hypothetical protein